MKKRNIINCNEQALKVTATNWVPTRSVGIAYKDLTNSWRLKFNIDGDFSVGASGNQTFTIDGVIFKNGVTQSISTNNPSADGGKALANGGASTITYYSPTAETTNWLMYSDVELDSKPNWLED